jgi:hypothetical protein
LKQIDQAGFDGTLWRAAHMSLPRIDAAPL